MPSGIQVFDGGGAVIMDTSTWVVKGKSYDVGEITSNGSLDLSAVAASGAVIQPLVTPVTNSSLLPAVTVSGGVVSWSGTNYRANLRIMLA